MAKHDEEAGQAIEVSAVIDRIEDGDVAVLSLDDEQQSQLDLPLARLPVGTSDGDHLRLTFTLDSRTQQRMLKSIVLDLPARANAAERVHQLQEQLEQRSRTQGKKDFKL